MQPLTDPNGGFGAAGQVSGGAKVNWPTTPAIHPPYGITLYDYGYVRYAANEKAELAFGQFPQVRFGLATAPAMPNIDISAAGAFTQVARQAGIVGSSETFDPYASEAGYLLAAYYILDAGVSYRGRHHPHPHSAGRADRRDAHRSCPGAERVARSVGQNWFERQRRGFG